MTHFRGMRPILLVTVALSLGACADGFDVDMRDLSGGFDTTDATRLATEPRPRPDARGVISYPTFQIALAQSGDTIGEIALRLGLDAGELAAYNGIAVETPLREGEVVALPRRVAAEDSGVTAGGGTVDIASLATGALDRAGPTPNSGNNTVETATLEAPPVAPDAGPEPVRHKVKRGETAFQIARLYRVSARALAEWNGLGPDMNLREGQVLLIPVASEEQPAGPVAGLDPSIPGEGTITPEPPSSTQPLPDENQVASVEAPPSPNLGEDRSSASDARLMMPVAGSIIRPYDKGKNEGIDIAAPAGSAVRAANDGVVAAITRDTNEVPILVLRHPDNLLTVYANIENVAVKKGDNVVRGQSLAEVRETSPSFLHFEVREGFDSVDPVPYVN